MTAFTATWNYPTHVLAGPAASRNSRRPAATAGITRPLLVTDAGLRDADIIARALDAAGTRAGWTPRCSAT